MARVTLPEVSSLNSSQKVQYERFPTNLTRAMLITSKSTGGYLSLGASFTEGLLNDKDRELVIMRVGALSGSAYEKMQHLRKAEQAGWSVDDLFCIEHGKPLADVRSNTILRFVDQCVADVKVSLEVFSAIRKYLSEAQVVELTLLIGHYMMTARFLETLEVDLDDLPADWSNMHSSVYSS